MTDQQPSRNPLWIAYEYLAILAVIGVFCFISFCWMPFALIFQLFAPLPIRRRCGRFMIMDGFRTYLRFLRFAFPFRFDLSELARLADEKPLIIAANHPSLLDAVLIVSCLPNAVCVMKASLMDNFVFGVCARLAGYIRNNAPLAMILNAREVLQDGAHLVIFPEGTRTEVFPVSPCSSSIGLIASRTGIPVQTLLIDYSTPYLGKAWPMSKRPILPLNCRVRLGRRFEPVRDVTAFTAELEAYFRSELGQKTPSTAAMAV
jgi:1-acyl-sn-glycerol-3-phosphate acyltransferase